MHQDDVALIEHLFGPGNIERQQIGIGPGGDNDRIFGLLIDRNQRHSRWILLIDKDKTRIDTLLGILLPIGDTEHIVPRFANKTHLGSETGRGYCLIRALTALIHHKGSSKHCLSRSRQMIGANHHVGVRTPDD